MVGRINHSPGPSMRDTHLLQLALSVDSPWFVSASHFDAEGKRLDIEIEFNSGARLPCPDCKAADCPVHHTKLWRVVHHYVETPLAELDMSALKRVSVDETKSRLELRGSRYLLAEQRRQSVGSPEPT